jgi:hypothetical protein
LPSRTRARKKGFAEHQQRDLFRVHSGRGDREGNPVRLSLKEVKTGENYALVVSNNAGLWGYSIGDMVGLCRSIPTGWWSRGRTKHFISAFGEHVIGEEVEYSLMKAAGGSGAADHGIHGCPDDQQEKGRSYHEWFVEFGDRPADLSAFAIRVDNQSAFQKYLLRRPDHGQYPATTADPHCQKEWIHRLHEVGR